jgi:hypothetical protein
MKRGVGGMPALLAEALRRLMFEADLDQLLLVHVVLAEVSAETALAVFDLHGHDVSPFCLRCIAVIRAPPEVKVCTS